MRCHIIYFSCISLFLLFSCQSAEPVYTDGMTPEDYFQMAQERADHGDYGTAIKIYFKMKETYPDNLEKNIWASYEIAFLYHKTGNDAKALELFDELLTLYSQDKHGVLPGAPKLLAEKVKDNIQNKDKYSNKTAPMPPTPK